MKAATALRAAKLLTLKISIHAAREGGDCVFVAAVHGDAISIHAAREGGDLIKQIENVGGVISIHAAREGGDVPRSRVLCFS